MNLLKNSTYQFISETCDCCKEKKSNHFLNPYGKVCSECFTNLTTVEVRLKYLVTHRRFPETTQNPNDIVYGDLDVEI